MDNTISYQLNEQEHYQAMQLTLRRASKGRLIFQAALLAVLAAFCLADFIMAPAPKPAIRLVIAITAIVLIPAQWLLPNWQFRRVARETAARGATLHLSIQPDAIRVEQGEQAVHVPHAEWEQKLSVYPKQQLAVLQIDQEQWIAIPRRVLPPESWELLLNV